MSLLFDRGDGVNTNHKAKLDTGSGAAVKAKQVDPRVRKITRTFKGTSKSGETFANLLLNADRQELQSEIKSLIEQDNALDKNIKLAAQGKGFIKLGVLAERKLQIQRKLAYYERRIKIIDYRLSGYR